MLLLLGVFAYRGRTVLNFFNTYVKNGYQTTVVTDLENIYAPTSLLLLAFLILLLDIALLVLMIHKKKPYRLYLFLAIYYILIFIGLFYTRNVLFSFRESLLAATAARSLRDIIVILYLPQFVFIIFILLRAVGFDLKKFNFASDLRQMDYSSQDAEEFELNFNFEGYKAEQKSRRFLREMRYYIKENKFVVISIFLVLVIIIGRYIFSNVHNNYDRSYGMNREFIYEKLNIKFEDAIITNLDYNGNIIKDKYYLVIRANIQNKTGTTIQIDYNNFKLDLGSKVINPSLGIGNNFIDFAPSIVQTNIAPNADFSFSIAYELAKSDIKKVKKITIHNGTVYDNGTHIDRHIFINLKYKTIDSVSIVGNYHLGDSIIFKDTFLENTSINIKSYSVNKKYLYKYKECVSSDNCNSYDDMLTISPNGANDNRVLLVLESDYSQELSTPYARSFTSLNSFVNNFCKIQYRVNEKIYSDISTNVTPSNANDFIAFEVPQQIEYADLIQIVITIRNKTYMYVIYT